MSTLWPRNKPLNQPPAHGRAPLTQAILKEELHYDPETGVFVWRKNRKGLIGPGSIAGGVSGEGYRRIMVRGTRYAEHRLAWLYVYGDWPSGEIDHINRKKDDNRIANLRDVTRSQNQQNASLQRNNTSGFRGVSWNKRDKRWFAYIRVNGALKHLGSHRDIWDACRAYELAAASLHTHNPLAEGA